MGAARRQRLILCAGDFNHIIQNRTLWLRLYGCLQAGSDTPLFEVKLGESYKKSRRIPDPLGSGWTWHIGGNPRSTANPRFLISSFNWRATVSRNRNQARTEWFCLVLRWRPARPKQSNSNRNQSITGEPSQGSTGVDCCKKTQSNSKFVDAHSTLAGQKQPRGSNAVEDRSTGGLALPAVPPA